MGRPARAAVDNGLSDAAGKRLQGRSRSRNVSRILEAASRVFAQKGFDGATMAEIAAASGLPKANLHYYFGTKDGIYKAVLGDILEVWLESIQQFTIEKEPAQALEAYVRAKMAHARSRPYASRVFANEMLCGAPVLHPYLSNELRSLVDEKASVIRGWIEKGLMAPIDPRHLFFAIWAMTQTYSDFEPQVEAVLGSKPLDDADFEAATATVLALVLGGCGVGTREIKGQG